VREKCNKKYGRNAQHQEKCNTGNSFEQELGTKSVKITSRIRLKMKKTETKPKIKHDAVILQNHEENVESSRAEQ
jgi:hypothetical protein